LFVTGEIVIVPAETIQKRSVVSLVSSPSATSRRIRANAKNKTKQNKTKQNVRQEEHAVTLLSLSHRHARTIPESLRNLRLLIVVVSARTQRRSELVLVFRQPLNDNRGDALIHAKIRPAPSRVLFRKLSHHLQALLRRPYVHHRPSIIARTHVSRSFARRSIVTPIAIVIVSIPRDVSSRRRRRASSRTGIRANARTARVRGHARVPHARRRHRRRRRRHRHHHRPRPRVRSGGRNRGRSARTREGGWIECLVSQRWNDGRLAGVTHTATTTRVRARERRREVGDGFAARARVGAPRVSTRVGRRGDARARRRAEARATPTRT